MESTPASEAEAVGFLDNGFHFLAGVLRGVGIVALGHDTAGSADLDDVSAVLDVLANFVANRIDSIGDPWFDSVIFRSEQIVVAVTAGDAQSGTAGEDTRAGNVALIDGIAQGDIAIATSADVADGCKASLQRHTGVASAH
jgi:hypothetical protein